MRRAQKPEARAVARALHCGSEVIAGPQATRNEAAPASGSEASSAAGCHILVVDDDVELCELLALRARANGYRVTTAPGIAPTLEQLEREAVDVILLDLDLGVGHGFDVLDAVVMRRPHLPIIVLTASGTVDTEAEARRRGAAGFVTKPFHHRDLLQRISRAVRDARARSPAPGSWG